MLKTCIAIGFPTAELNALLPGVSDRLNVVGFADDLDEAAALMTERVPDAVIVYGVKEGETEEDYLKLGSGKTEVVFVARAGTIKADGVKYADCSDGYRALKTVLDSDEKKEIRLSREKALDERIANIFITAGIPPHIKGYQFLREAVKQTVDVPEMINNITKQLYPAVAKRFMTSPSKVERAIRHAIEVAWSRGKIENINNIYGIKIFGRGEKPTNGELIALVADKLIIEYSL